MVSIIASFMENMVIKQSLIKSLGSGLRGLDPDFIGSVDIPVTRVPNGSRIRYISAIAMKLAAINSQSPAEIATLIVANQADKMVDDGIITTVLPSGMIQFDITDFGVVKWLENIRLHGLPITANSPDNQSLDSGLFPVQYIHARCCSLLRMAHRDRLISLVETEPIFTPFLWRLATPRDLPWLDDSGNLRLVHDAEKMLIGELIDGVDFWHYPPRKIDDKKVAMKITEQCDRFLRQCPIWGEVKLHHPQLSQARLGLIIVTQSILRFALQEKLGIIAPMEL
ncbi:MAG: arginyl-tRNA synthetase [Limnospira sp. PMC 1291.21]|uniref:Arginyl-tRNA synthetase n=4 Tax=Limnospira TaxID=2596745 RepID=A0ABU9EJY0_LIMFS|nr:MULTISPECIES: arginyl-tRNA synthetase [Limnospira]MDT9189065.1 arginyl-tRNA synthetase [Limnospira sp. PMC 894.15]MDT9193584.1 arginyl-tRNA synthetase [Limnospira sp. PMC 1245.20]MDT9244516.1 arginyl-tRNA synthetase [Limnospira sp. PMC 1249.20]MDT9259982.1 arginyl-tRNA synthetase [Limnospira sp. PMC 1236.20]MDY7054580.1 arginyl-tRNA synthetase [Limnospira fusiformis LS22]QJB28742.1 arginyl-tRNA synthetase [Limnospira fusiformis SAG 85.79]